jgi:hypothetical protein
MKPFKKTLSYKLDGITDEIRQAIIEQERCNGYFFDGFTCYGISGDVEMEFVEMEYQIAENKKQQAEYEQYLK